MLLTGISAGSDIKYQEEKIIAARNFANKLWNAARFIFMSLGQIENIAAPAEAPARPHFSRSG